VTLGDDAERALGMIIAAVRAGNVPLKSGKDAAELIKVLHSVTRLEAGQVTDLTGTLSLDEKALDSAIAAIEAKAKTRSIAEAGVPEVVEATRGVTVEAGAPC